ncbi:MAG TPA: SAM-dependent methyltransferase [Bacteroidales bacterium]|nr:SAM-dependent methyltransferase [Bacteroidales bacterium]
MAQTDNKVVFINEISSSLNENRFVKLTLSHYTGGEEQLKNIYIKRILVKNEYRLSFTYRYTKKDIVKNFPIDEGIRFVDQLIGNQFYIANLMTTENDFVYEKFRDKTRLKVLKPTTNQVPSLSHDKEKNRMIKTDDSKLYLHLLGITDKTGKVIAKSQDKYKQINNYIEILSPVLKEFKPQSTLRIADMGSGKGYLTFGLYDYLKNELHFDVKITGVEFRKELVNLCNEITAKSGFASLNFVEGEIQNYNVEALDVIIALHACDTATDDAIAKGIKTGAGLIVTAPCCQHQIRQEITKNKTQNTLSPITKHGIFLERQAELLTDGIRALILEYFGYKTKIVEFISDAHTHKNVMIIARKTSKTPSQDEIKNQIKDIKIQFGISNHYLEKLLFETLL